MAFMSPYYEKGQWYVVETTHGSTVVPHDIVASPTAEGFKDYVEGEYRSHELVKGWGVRLSAPGYLDCTEWHLFDTEAECREHVKDFWEVDPDTGDELPEEA